ncbi:MAG TPA: carboxylate--amine ligase [Solibacterales bacterium]|nr:carboxylate--amine ligase [Bryobacterales bacterium]
MTPRVLLAAATTGYQTRVFAAAAQRLGFAVTLATDRCHILEDPWADGAIAVRFEKPEQSARLIEGPFDGVIAVGDRPALLAAHAASRLGVRFHPVPAVEACGNKFLAREQFRAAGLRVPAYFRAAFEEGPRAAARRASYPCVLKPLGLSASRGVIRAGSEAEFHAAFERIRRLLAAPDLARLKDARNGFLQVEDYIPGREYALEGVMSGARLHVLALFDKPDPLEGPFFEETIYVTPSREDQRVQSAIVETAREAVRALGMTDGPVHAEMRVNGQGVWMLEVAARPIGGLCAKALTFDGGAPLEELLLRNAVGEDVRGAKLDGPATGVMMIPIPKAGVYRGVRGEAAAAATPGIQAVEITAKDGQALLPLPEGASYLGFLFARGPNPAAVERSLRQAHAELAFDIAVSLPALAPARAAS